MSLTYSWNYSISKSALNKKIYTINYIEFPDSFLNHDSLDLHTSLIIFKLIAK